VILAELIQASCIDSLEELRDARDAIVASPKRDELEKKLRHFPFDQKEALLRAAEYQKAKPIERLSLMRKWTRDFREEYIALEREARQ
jgi:hypothetical protein